MKKLISLLLALVLVAGLGFSAFGRRDQSTGEDNYITTTPTYGKFRALKNTNKKDITPDHDAVVTIDPTVKYASITTQDVRLLAYKGDYLTTRPSTFSIINKHYAYVGALNALRLLAAEQGQVGVMEWSTADTNSKITSVAEIPLQSISGDLYLDIQIDRGRTLAVKELFGESFTNNMMVYGAAGTILPFDASVKVGLPVDFNPANTFVYTFDPVTLEYGPYQGEHTISPEGIAAFTTDFSKDIVLTQGQLV